MFLKTWRCITTVLVALALCARALGACRNAAEPATRARRAGEVGNSQRIMQSPEDRRHDVCARREL